MLITIGAFDGFHKGHAQLLNVCRQSSLDGGWGVVTFHPHPSVFMGKVKPLFTLEEKKLISKILGIPEMFVLKFDEALKNLTPEEFWRLLTSKINVDGVVMGSDFRFGRNREGNADSLRELAIADGLSPSRIITLNLVKKSEYSSSVIRNLTASGKVKKAAEILGYPFFMMGKVIHGDERGRTMKVPTANLEFDEKRIVPAFGVYACAVLVRGSWHCGALSIGNNPTFNVDGTRIEVHLPDFNGNIYGEEIIVMFLERVRDIRKFAGKDELISQIKIDIDECRRCFNFNVNRHTLPLEQ